MRYFCYIFKKDIVYRISIDVYINRYIDRQCVVHISSTGNLLRLGGSLVNDNNRSQLRASCSFFRLTLTSKVVLAFVYVNIFFFIVKLLLQMQGNK